MKKTLQALSLFLMLMAWADNVSAAAVAAAVPSRGLAASEVARVSSACGTMIDLGSDVTIKEGEEDGEHWQEGVLYDEFGFAPQERDYLTPIWYSYEGDDIFESFDEDDGHFVLKKGAFGTATITATYDGDEQYGYLGSTASYTVTYRPYKCTLAFSASVVDVVRGGETLFTEPTLTWTDGDGKEVPTENLEWVEYESSNENVATVDTYSGEVELHDLGTATITATAKDKADRQLTASYTLKYRIQPELVCYNRPDFDGTLNCVVNPYEWAEGVIYFPYVDGQPLNDTSYLDGVSIESQDPSVAKVRNDDGCLLVLGEGTTTITFAYAGNDTYAPVSTTYTVVATDPTVQATFRFDTPARYGYGASSGESHDGDIEENAAIVERGHIELVCPTKTGETPNRFYSPSGSGDDVVLELYAGTVLSVSTGEKSRISSITARGTKGGEAIEITDWTISDNKSIATVEIDDDVRLSSLTVDYHLIQVTIDENDEKSYDNLLDNFKNVPMNANLKRKLVGGSWNTLSLPFDTEIKGSPLEGAIVKRLGSVTGNVLNFVDADRMEAGKPYLVKPAGDVVNPTFNSVLVKKFYSEDCWDGESPYFFIGNVTPSDMNWFVSAMHNGKFYGVTAGGKLARINDNSTVKGLRAIFLFQKQAAEARLNIDGEPTGIVGVEADRAQSGKVYNLEGQCVGDSLDGLPGGIYIVGGKKVKK